jgi:hypothetical protein
MMHYVLLVEHNASYKVIKKYKVLIDGVVSKSKNSKINNLYNIHDNAINNTNNNTNNIIFNGPVNFGDEDISKIKKIDILSAIKTLTDCFPNFIKIINLNSEHPENQNILFNNMQNNIGTIVEDNKLVVKTKTEIISEVISTRLPNLESIVEKYYEEKLLSKREYIAIKELMTFLQRGLF